MIGIEHIKGLCAFDPSAAAFFGQFPDNFIIAALEDVNQELTDAIEQGRLDSDMAAYLVDALTAVFYRLESISGPESVTELRALWSRPQ